MPESREAMYYTLTHWWINSQNDLSLPRMNHGLLKLLNCNSSRPWMNLYHMV